jgi:hypothetical protein
MTGHRSGASSPRFPHPRLRGSAPLGIVLAVAAALVPVAPARALPRDDLEAACNANPGAISLTVTDPNTGSKFLYYCGSGEMMECAGDDCTPCTGGNCSQPGEIIDVEDECPEGWIRDLPGTRCIPPEEQECPRDETYDPLHQQCMPVPDGPSDDGEDDPGSPGMSCGPNARPVWNEETREWVCEGLGLGACEQCERQMESCIADVEGDRQLCFRTGRAWARRLCTPHGGTPGEQWDGSPLESAWIDCDDSAVGKELGGRGRPVNCKGAVIDVCIMGHMQDHPGESTSEGGRHKTGGKFKIEVGKGPLKGGYEASEENTELWERTISWDGVTGIASACTREIKTAALEICNEVLRDCLLENDPANECELSSGYTSTTSTAGVKGPSGTTLLESVSVGRATSEAKALEEVDPRVMKTEIQKLGLKKPGLKRPELKGPERRP